MGWLDLTTFQLDFSSDNLGTLPPWIKEIKQRITRSGQNNSFEKSWKTTTFKGTKCLTNIDIGDSDRTDYLIYLALPKDITCTIEYCIDSESYDKFAVWVDDNNKLDKGGQTDGFQKLTFDVPKNSGDVQFGYIKDSSNSYFSDSAYIKSITFSGLPPCTEVRWLVKNDDKYKSYVDNKWIDIDAKSTVDTICKVCAKDPPPADALAQLHNPVVIKWLKDNVLKQSDNFTYVAVPKAMIVTQKVSTNFGYSYITGINQVTIDCTLVGNGDIKFIFSADDGNTWKTYVENTWKDISLSSIDMLSSGMTIQTVQGLTQANWKQLVGDSRMIKFACVITTQSSKDNVKLRQVYYKYITEGTV